MLFFYNSCMTLRQIVDFRISIIVRYQHVNTMQYRRHGYLPHKLQQIMWICNSIAIWKWKCVIFKCYSSEKLITLNTLHEVVSTWYSFHSWVDWSNADKASCSRTQHAVAGVRTVYLCIQKPTF